MTRCYIIYVPTLRCILLYSGSKNYLFFLFIIIYYFFFITKKLLLLTVLKLQTLNKKKKKTMKKCHTRFCQFGLSKNLILKHILQNIYFIFQKFPT